MKKKFLSYMGKEILNKVLELKKIENSAWKLYEEKTNFDLNLVDKKVKKIFYQNIRNVGMRY